MHDMNTMQNKRQNPTTKEITYHISEKGKSWSYEYGKLYPGCYTNLVMVPKKDKSWRLCINFKDLNKACPKDPFPLPRIDQIIDTTAGHDSPCFLDAYSGYHQIKMAECSKFVVVSSRKQHNTPSVQR